MPCPSNKVQHGYSEAQRLAKRASRKYDSHMQAYRCLQCGDWHVGSAPHKARPLRWVNNNHELRCV